MEASYGHTRTATLTVLPHRRPREQLDAERELALLAPGQPAARRAAHDRVGGAAELHLAHHELDAREQLRGAEAGQPHARRVRQVLDDAELGRVAVNELRGEVG